LPLEDKLSISRRLHSSLIFLRCMRKFWPESLWFWRLREELGKVKDYSIDNFALCVMLPVLLIGGGSGALGLWGSFYNGKSLVVTSFLCSEVLVYLN
jgi:hypothetical protein